MSTAQRMSRGFHWLGLLVATIPLLWFGATGLNIARDKADSRHQQVLCAHNSVDEIEQAIRDGPAARLPKIDRDEKDEWKVIFFAPDEWEVSFAKCSISEAEPMTLGEARNPPTLHWLRVFTTYAAAGIALALGIAACVYGLIRSIGRVIGGFAAS